MPDPGGLRTPKIGCASMLARMLSVWSSIGNQRLCPVPGNPESSRKCALSEWTCSRHRSSIARVVRMPRSRYLNCTLGLSQDSDGLYRCCSYTSLMYLLLHDWGRELPFLTITLCCCLPLRELTLRSFAGRALQQQVSSQYSHTPGRSPQKVAAHRPAGARSRLRIPYQRCALGTCERSDTPAATERRIRPATRNLKARAVRLAWVAKASSLPLRTSS